MKKVLTGMLSLSLISLFMVILTTISAAEQPIKTNVAQF